MEVVLGSRDEEQKEVEEDDDDDEKGAGFQGFASSLERMLPLPAIILFP